MTNEEFTTWSRKLFIAYPSLWEWLERNSPDTTATLEAWRDKLRSYTFDECIGVLSGWDRCSQHPFAAYERDQVPAIVRSVIDKQRDKARKREEQAAIAQDYREQRRRTDGRLDNAAGHFSIMDSEMQAAYEEGIPLQKQLDEGEITKEEYRVRRAEIIEKHLGASEPTMQEWVP